MRFLTPVERPAKPKRKDQVFNLLSGAGQSLAPFDGREAFINRFELPPPRRGGALRSLIACSMVCGAAEASPDEWP